MQLPKKTQRTARVVPTPKTVKKARVLLGLEIRRAVLEEIKKARHERNFKEVVSLCLNHFGKEQGVKMSEHYLISLVLEERGKFVAENKAELIQAINLVKKSDPVSASRINHVLRQFE